MKKHLFLLTLLLFCLFNSAEAARSNTVRVKGVVIDKTTTTPLEFSTVSLSDSNGKTIAVNTCNDKGVFTLPAVPAGSYTLKVSFVGYADVLQPLTVNDSPAEIDLGSINIEPDSKQLDAVVISTKKPSVERQIYKLVVNIANTIAADNSTALELLKKAPGIAIDRDGNVTLNGQAVQVWVDNRPTQLSGQDLVSLLSSTEGSTIDKIEIIDNPSSKYDAAGSAGIINIKTKKNFIRGFNGNVRTGYTQYLENVDGYYYSANAGVNFNYRNDLLSTFINYGIRRSEGFGKYTEELTTDIDYQRYSQALSKDQGTPQNIKTGIDFFVDKKNTIGVIGNLSFRSMDEKDNSSAIVGPQAAPEETSVTTGESNRPFLNGTLNMNYTHLFGSNENHDLTINLDYIYNKNNPRQYSHTDFSTAILIPKPPVVFQSNSDQYTQVFSAKADYTQPINDKMKIEAGGKLSYSHNDSEILRMDSLPGGWQKNTQLSNAFEYDETISALYLNYSWQINKQWSAKAGLRWENTYSKGTWKTADSLTSQQYNDFFPTLFLSYTPHEKHTLSLSYTRRLQRPNYWQLNPFRRYAGAYTYIEGNPALAPSYSDNARLSYTAFQVLNIGTSFSYNQGMIVQIPVFDPLTGQTGYTQGNFGYNYYTGAWVSVSGLPVTSWFHLTLSLWGAYTVNNDNITTTNSWQANLYSNATFLLSKTWSAEVEGWMSTPSVWGYYDIKAQGSVDFGVKKTFWDDKASVSLYLEDIFNTQRSNVTMSRDGMVSYNENSWDSRAIRFSFTWRFGNMNAPAKQRNVGQQEEAERMGGGK